MRSKRTSAACSASGSRRSVLIPPSSLIHELLYLSEELCYRLLMQRTLLLRRHGGA
ncbi:hypothetical protein ACFPRL_12600 [Pseudoclavibacter helvolus]